MRPTYIILVEIAGEVTKAFTWTRDKASGIARARSECQHADRIIAVSV